MNIYTLRKQVGQEELDYQLLKSLLSDVAYPRDKITYWLKTKALTRVKKGLYVFGSMVAQKPFSNELLANLIYGPSAISLEYALAFYGIIPERVYTITSITCKRNKYFSTPVGEFSYRYLPLSKYTLGLTRFAIDSQRYIFIATPEKALVDTLWFSPIKKTLKTIEQLEQYLFEDLRVNENELKNLDIFLLETLAKSYKSPIIHQLIEHIK